MSVRHVDGVIIDLKGTLIDETVDTSIAGNCLGTRL